MDKAASRSGVLDVLIRSRPGGRFHRAIWIGKPYGQVRRSALLCDVEITVLTNLAGVVSLSAAGVALYFDDCLPPGDSLTCEPQVLTFRLALLQRCVHVADYEPEVRKNILDCGNQVITVGQRTRRIPFSALSPSAASSSWRRSRSVLRRSTSDSICEI